MKRLFLLIGSLMLAEGRRVSEKIYVTLGDNSQCFRLFNGTHQIGCQSERYGNVGSLALVTNETGLTDLIKLHSHLGPFIAAMDYTLLATNTGVEEVLRSSSHISGVILFYYKAEQTREDVPPFGADDPCPGSHLDGYPGCSATGPAWNAAGRDIWRREWSKPVFLLYNETEIAVIKEHCWAKNAKNDGWPRCGARLKFWMFGAKDAVTCIRRNHLFDGIDTGTGAWKTCAPMSDRNVFAAFPPANASVPEEKHGEGSVLVLATRLDSVSMFTDQTPGLQSTLAGVTVLLAVAEALGKDADIKTQLFDLARKNSRSLLFALFNGATDESRPWTMSPSDLGFVLEVGPTAQGKDGLFAHVDSTVYEQHTSRLDPIISELGSTRQSWPRGVFPPASYSSFLRTMPDLPGLLLSDSEQAFKNEYFDSFLDTGARLATRKAEVVDTLAKTARGVLKTALNWIKAPKEIVEIDDDLVRDLWNCMGQTERWDKCQIFANALPPYEFKDSLHNPLAHGKPNDRTYVTPIGGGYSKIRAIVNGSLSYWLGDRLSLKREDCYDDKDQMNVYYYLRNPKGPANGTEYCCKAPVYVRMAQSPAVDMEDYASANYSTWTESTWGTPSLEVFLMPSQVWEGITLLIGIVVLIISFAITALCVHRSSLLFPPTPVPL